MHLGALDVEAVERDRSRLRIIAIEISKCLPAVEVDDGVPILEEAARVVVEAASEHNGGAKNGAVLIDGAALEDVDQVARNAVGSCVASRKAAGAVVGDLESESGGSVASGDSWGCADGSGEEGSNEGEGELHFDGGGVVWLV